MAGLAAAVDLARAGHKAELVDGAAQAGGRCRSYHDPQLGRTIDNGNHLVLSGNRAVVDAFREGIAHFQARGQAGGKAVDDRHLNPQPTIANRGGKARRLRQQHARSRRQIADHRAQRRGRRRLP
jgi:phytoene dehydrogenase-like protein